jgi:hypothetical protein
MLTIMRLLLNLLWSLLLLLLKLLWLCLLLQVLVWWLLLLLLLLLLLVLLHNRRNGDAAPAGMHYLGHLLRCRPVLGRCCCCLQQLQAPAGCMYRGSSQLLHWLHEMGRLSSCCCRCSFVCSCLAPLSSRSWLACSLASCRSRRLGCAPLGALWLGVLLLHSFTTFLLF